MIIPSWGVEVSTIMPSYKVEHFTNDTTNPKITNITQYVHSIDYANFYSDGRINTASLTLQADEGKFMTLQDSNIPILQNFDRIRITAIDSQSRTYHHIFEIINDLAQLTNQSNYLLPLTLEGRERALAAIPFSGYFDPPLSHFEMAEKILETYAISFNPKLQPIIDTEDDELLDINFLPKYNPNIWDFQYIDNCLDALKAVVRLANQSVAGGGAGDRFAIIFDDANSYLRKINLKIIPQGENNKRRTPPIIRANELVNPIQTITKVKQPLTASAVIARGKPGTGGTPPDGDIYKSRLEFYQRIQSRQNWNSTITYAKDSYTSFNGLVYRANTTNTNSRPPSSNWSSVSVGQFIGDKQYSPFTIMKASLYRNECTNPKAGFSSESEDSPKMLDCNIVIDDVETQRDWVYIRAITDNVGQWSTDQREYTFRNKVYEGFRILVDSSLGTPTGVFSLSQNHNGTGNGKDPNGLYYNDNQCVYARDGNGNFKWFVIKEHEDFDQTVVRHEGLFEWNVDFSAGSRYPASNNANTNRRLRQSGGGTPNGWRKLGKQFLANDCLHSPSSITNSPGLIYPENKNGGGKYTDNSAVKIIYEYSNNDNMPQWRKVLDQILGVASIATGFLGSFALGATTGLYDLFLTPYYRNAGWWITFSAPFPVSTFNSIKEQVGELYGAGKSSRDTALNDHSTFDVFNQTSTFTGKNGFAEDDSNGMMEISGVSFLFKLDITANDKTIPFTGDIPCSYWVMDDNGTLWKSKKVYRLIGDVQKMTFEFGDFSPVYRARTPFGINSIITNVLTPELEVRERLFPNRIRMQGFQLEGSYDDKGRYMPNLWENIIKPTIITMFDPKTITANVKFIGEIDMLQWIKTPIAIAKQPNATRTIFAEIKDYPNITNIEQLQRAADADLDVEIFQYEQYSITRNDKADIQLQDTVYLYEEKMISEAEAPTPNAPSYSSNTEYIKDDLVLYNGIRYISVQNGNKGNNPSNNLTWWDRISNPVKNTRKLTVGEITFSVTAQKDVKFDHTLIRRIPKKE